MRTTPLPNRHGADLLALTRAIQKTLNNNRGKPSLHEMTLGRLLLKLLEELLELGWELVLTGLRWALRRPHDLSGMRHETQDVCVVLLGIWTWAGGGGAL